MGISWIVLIPTVILVSLFFAGIGYLVLRTHLQRSMTGAAGMIGERGVAFTPLQPEGKVFVNGEYWKAVSEEPVAAGEAVEVVQVENLKLRVRRVS